jgi:hypothetical protein
MSGAEAGLVIGLISGTLAIVGATKKVYDAAKDKEGLPTAFREVALRLPLVQNILSDAKALAEGGQLNDEVSKSMESILEACNLRIEKLKEIFEKVIPQEGSSSLDRYYKAVRALGKDGKVEILMRGIIEDLKLLSMRCGMATGDYIDKLREATDTLSTLEPSVPDYEFGEPTYTNNNLGGGTQNNFNAPVGKSFSNTGPGTQFAGDIGTLHYGKQ